MKDDSNPPTFLSQSANWNVKTQFATTNPASIVIIPVDSPGRIFQGVFLANVGIASGFKLDVQTHEQKMELFPSRNFCVFV
jgi:hypothetical protein